MFPCINAFCNRSLKLMRILSLKKVINCCGLLILLNYSFWIYITHDLELHNADERRKLNNYGLNYTFARAKLAHARLNRHFAKDVGRNGRPQAFVETKGAKIYAKDFHLLWNIRRAWRYFGRYINSPVFKKKHDFRKYQSPEYLKNFKNPCFLLKNRSFDRFANSRTIVQLRCVPYFMIAGFPKCGTTDLWSKLRMHPEVVWLHWKEINFFNKAQYTFFEIEEAVSSYQNSFTVSTDKIKACVSKNAGNNLCIIGDASVDTVFDNRFWRQLPGNENQTEPVVTNANYVYKINPNMKVIFVLREPTERLYSDYLFMSRAISYVTSPEDFHNTVVDRIRNFSSCRRKHTLRACAYDIYDDWNIQTYKVRLNVGMYHIFLSDWLKIFPRRNILVVKSENTRGPNRFTVLRKIFRFLGLAVPSRKHTEETYKSRSFLNQRNKTSKQMYPKTRILLQNFYKAFNKKLEIMFPHMHY